MKDTPETNKALGQHWLTDQASLEAIVDAASLHTDDTVLEIGPGPGYLTALILPKVKNLVAVELDAKLASDLRTKFAARNLEVINADILKYDFSSLVTGYKVVANIPYYLTGNLLQLLSEAQNSPSLAVLLVQKEVAERATASPGQGSMLSLTIQYYWQAQTGIEVNASLFTPPPKVDSQVLILAKRPEPLYDDISSKNFFRIARAGFSQRRKTLLNSLSAGLALDKQTVKTICESVDIDPGRRAQTLSLDEWHNLCLSFET